MTSIGGVGGFRPPPPGKPPSFDKLDGNSDGVLNLDEFAAGAPKGADSAKIEKRFKALDADQDGSVSKAESDAFKAKFEKADQQMQALLLMLQSDTASATSAKKADAKDGDDKNYFAKLDADSDGSVAKEEFLKAVAPDGDGSNGLLSRLFAAMDADQTARSPRRRWTTSRSRWRSVPRTGRRHRRKSAARLKPMARPTSLSTTSAGATYSRAA